MRKTSKEDLLKPGKKLTGWKLLCLCIFLISAAICVAGFFENSVTNTGDDFSRRNFLFIFGGSWALISGVGFLLFLAGNYAAKKRGETLLQYGQLGRAVVLNIEEIGESQGSPIMVKILLEIHLEGLAPYQIEERMEIPILKISQLQPGLTVEVLAAPAVPGARLSAVELLYK